MGKVKVVLNGAGVRALLKSAEMEKCIADQANAIQGRCGSGYATDTKQMGTRVIASVYTDDSKAYKDNLDNNTLLRAMK